MEWKAMGQSSFNGVMVGRGAVIKDGEWNKKELRVILTALY